MNHDEALQAAVRETMANIGALVARGPVDRAALDEIKNALCALASRGDLLSFERFTLPEGQISALYTLATDGTSGCTLYANRSDGGLQSPPHDHKIWAVIAAVHGTELNRLYHRETLADGSDHVEPSSEIELRDGAGIALMPNDVHSIRVPEGSRLLNLHLYGTPMERQAGRRRFDAQGQDAGHYGPQPLIL